MTSDVYIVRKYAGTLVPAKSQHWDQLGREGVHVHACVYVYECICVFDSG